MNFYSFKSSFSSAYIFFSILSCSFLHKNFILSFVFGILSIFSQYRNCFFYYFSRILTIQELKIIINDGDIEMVFYYRNLFVGFLKNFNKNLFCTSKPNTILDGRGLNLPLLYPCFNSIQFHIILVRFCL